MFAEGRIVIVYTANVKLCGAVGSVTDTEILFGTPTTTTQNAQVVSAAYDSSANKVIAAFAYVGQYCGAVVGTVTNESVTFGPAVWEGTGAKSGMVGCSYDPISNKTLIACQDESMGGVGRLFVGTVSGDSITFGAGTTYDDSAVNKTYPICSTYDPESGRHVVTYLSTTGYVGNSVVVSLPGDTPICSDPVRFSVGSAYFISSTYDSFNNAVIVVCTGDGTSAYAGKVDGDTIAWTPPETIPEGAGFPSCAYHPAERRLVASYSATDRGGVGVSVTATPGKRSTNLSSNFIGMSAGDYSDGETATIQTVGAVSENQSGLTAGMGYYVEPDGSLGEVGEVFAGTALSENKIIVKG